MKAFLEDEFIESLREEVSEKKEEVIEVPKYRRCSYDESRDRKNVRGMCDECFQAIRF